MNRISEFDTFMNIPEKELPDHLSKKIGYRSRKLIFRHKITSIMSLILVHVITGFGVIAICPQFDIQLIDNFMGLTSIFMKFGMHVCMFCCGAFFLTMTNLFSAIFLPTVMKNYLFTVRYYKISLLSILTLLIFSAISIVRLDVFTLLWIMGAVTIGSLSSRLLTMKPGTALRQQT